jgi:hypothetical protein
MSLPNEKEKKKKNLFCKNNHSILKVYDANQTWRRH